MKLDTILKVAMLVLPALFGALAATGVIPASTAAALGTLCGQAAALFHTAPGQSNG